MKELTLKDIKVGKKYKVKPKYKDRCVFCSGFGFDYIKITAINDGDLYYDAIKDGRVVGSCTGCYEPEHLEPLAPTCFEELREGDVVMFDNGAKETVLFGNGLVVIIEDEDGITTTCSKSLFTKFGFTIPNAKPQLESNIAIELPADAVEILSNGKNAYIHMNGTVYRVIEESKYWKAISAERQRVLNEVEENLKFNQPKEFDTQTFRNYIAVEIDKLRKLNEK